MPAPDAPTMLSPSATMETDTPVATTGPTATPAPTASPAAGQGAAVQSPTATQPVATPLAPTSTPLPTVPASTSTPTLAGAQIPPGVAPRITPTGEFYTISKNFLDPLVRAEHWELNITGLVARPRTLRHGDLRALPNVSQPTTLTCISNEVGGGLIGTAVWTGIPLATLLTDAGVRPEATHVAFRCEDGYVETLPIARALDPAVLLVHTMNGEPLYEVHGFPARLIAPGSYGMKNPKWISRIEAVTRPPTGYWTERGWSPDEPIQTGARIDVPGLLETIPRGPTLLGGIAFAGDRGISRVEVSTDGGSTWLAAELEPALGPATWVRWVLPWTPTRAGDHTILARARDGKGAIQTASVRKSGPGGATGYARREVTVAS
jgi:DMSO/TMAO reductase YedYZ molybdopterin-dependent catalytic subunit